jgi:hypothetical protein
MPSSAFVSGKASKKRSQIFNLMRGDWGCAPTSEQNVATSAPLATLVRRVTGDGAGDAFKWGIFIMKKKNINDKKKYEVIYADPPWRFKVHSENGKGIKL